MSNGDVITYTYDGAYRLLGESRSNPQQPLHTFSQSFVYDEVGNRTSSTKNGVTYTYTYNNANQLVSESSVNNNINNTNNYTYDPNGNLINIHLLTNNNLTSVETMQYDSLGRQLTWTDGTHTETSVYRGGAWHRHSLSDGVGVTSFVYDGDNVVMDIVNNTVNRFYVSNGIDSNVSMYDIVTNSCYWYSHDGLGSVRTVTDINGAVVSMYDYTAFGEKFEPAIITANTITQRYSYTGREDQPHSEQMYYRFRNYSPSTGRFIHRDPIGYEGGINLYTYVFSNPLFSIDPYGLDYIIAWSYSADRDVLPFKRDYLNKNGYNVTVDNKTSDWTKEIWEEFDKRNAYSRAAQTKKDELITMGIPENEIIIQRIDGKEDLAKYWTEWSKLDTVEGLDFYSHGFSGGAEVHLGSGDFWDNAAKLNWGSTLRELTINGKKTGYINTPYAFFYGCETAKGTFAQNFANSQRVVTYAQPGKSNFSHIKDWFLGINPHSTKLNVHLNVYNEIIVFDTRIKKISMIPAQRFDPIKNR